MVNVPDEHNSLLEICRNYGKYSIFNSRSRLQGGCISVFLLIRHIRPSVSLVFTVFTVKFFKN